MDDLSALIFVALAVAWAAYLLPLALKHHDDAARSRTVDRFSHTLRVLARREPVSRSSARLVTPGRPAAAAEVREAVETAAVTSAPAASQDVAPAQLRARREAAARATKRRRNVLAVILLATLVVMGLAAFGVLAWPYVAVPVAVLAGWLVLCRVMVKGERRALGRPVAAPADRLPVENPAEDLPEQQPVAEPSAEEAAAEFDPMVDTSAGIAAVVDPAMWDPVPVTLPTYVGKPPAARRTVRTIDLDSTGVWTSGRTEADAKIAREADEADQAARQARRDGEDHRAVGS